MFLSVGVRSNGQSSGLDGTACTKPRWGFLIQRILCVHIASIHGLIHDVVFKI